MPAVYGLPGTKVPLARYRQTILAYGPMLYFPCNEAASATTLAEYAARMTLAKSGSPTAGNVPLAAGAVASAGVTSSNAWFGSALDPGNLATIGMIWQDAGSGTDEFFWGAWNGSGFGLGYSSGMVAYVAGTHTTGVTHTGTHLWIATYDGTNVRLYKDGVVVAGPTAATWSMGTPAWGINYYSAGARSAAGRISDAFLINRVLSDTQITALAALVRVP